MRARKAARLDVGNLDAVSPADEQHIVILPTEAAVVEIGARRALWPINVRDPLARLRVVDLDANVVGPRDQMRPPLNRRDRSLAAVQDSVFAAEPACFARKGEVRTRQGEGGAPADLFR